MIAYSEGTSGPDGYRTLFGGKLFDSYVYGNENAVKLFTSGQQVAFDSLDSLRALGSARREVGEMW